MINSGHTVAADAEAYHGRGELPPREFWGGREGFYMAAETVEEALDQWPFAQAVFGALETSGPTTARVLAHDNGWWVWATEAALDWLSNVDGHGTRLVTCRGVLDDHHGSASMKLWWREDAGTAGHELAQVRSAAWYASRDRRAAESRAARGDAL